jgi:hypothetical protein
MNMMIIIAAVVVMVIGCIVAVKLGTPKDQA